MKIFLVFKTHFDIGFTDLSANIIDQYAGKMLSDVIDTCDGTADMGALKYVWTMPAWPLTVMQQNKARRGDLDRLIREGQIAFHALPFTSHFDFGSVEDAIQGLKYARRLSEEYDLPMPISAKMTDVPGHGRALPTVLAGAGVKFLHLGSNEFATPPAVPQLFFWEGPDGSRVLTMYSKGGYGSTMLPPAEWPFPVWMALMHTHDNCGPQSADMIRRMVDQAHNLCPEAEIVCGTMDDFYRELSQCDLSSVPVIDQDLADSWIHGAGTFPLEVSGVRRARRTLTAAGSAVFAHARGEAETLAEHVEAAGDALALFDEHTWGIDVKTWMHPERVYEKAEFEAQRPSEEYRRMEQSWDEQRNRAWRAGFEAEQALALAADGSGVLTVWNPNGRPFTGWVEVPEGTEGAAMLAGRPYVYAHGVPALSGRPIGAQPIALDKNVLENHRYRLTVNRECGIIESVYDKKQKQELLRARDGIGVFAYQYDVYGIEDLTEYLRSFAYRFSDWGIRDCGRDNYPNCSHQTFRPSCTEISIEDGTVTLTSRSAACEAYGDGRIIRVIVSLPPAGEELFVRVEIEGKQATPYVESGSLLMPLAADAPRYRFNKNGDLIDPATDIIDCANHVLYCLEAFACAEEGDTGLCVVTRDAPLCAIGETGIYRYRPHYEPHTPVLCFNLFNNMWGTNFPQWIEGDLTYAFTLFGYRAPCGGVVMQRALELHQGAVLLPAAPASCNLNLPEGVQVMSLLPCASGWTLRLRDTALSARTGVLGAPGWRIHLVDLVGRSVGQTCDDEIVCDLTPCGVYSFVLEEK